MYECTKIPMQKFLLVTTAIFLLAAACGKQAQVQPVQNQEQQNQQTRATQEQSQANPPSEPNKMPSLPTVPPIPGIKGFLKTSDNLSKGNLMLVETDVTSKSGRNITIYLQTKRDFSPLLNKKVTVQFEGGPDQFVLKEIQEVK